jgi:Family of unknown function (DUF6263)
MRAITRLLVALVVMGAVASLGAVDAEARKAQAPSPPQVEVLDPGSAPREALRIAPAVGTSESVTMTMRLDIEQSGVSDVSVNAPPIRAAISASIAGVTPSGDFQVPFTYPSFEVLKRKGSSAAERNRIASALEPFDGVSGQLTLTPQGAVVDSTLDIPDDADADAAQLLRQLRDQFRDLSVPLPEEPIGVGGRWRSTTQLTANGIRARQTNEYRLKNRTGTSLELDVRGSQTARRQTVEAPGGVTLRLERYKTTIRGSTTADLSRVLPVAGQVRGSGDQTFDVRTGGESGELTQHIDVRVTLAPQ